MKTSLNIILRVTRPTIRLRIPTAQDDECPLLLASIIARGPRRWTLSMALPLALILSYDDERPSRRTVTTGIGRRTGFLLSGGATVALIP